MNLVWSDTSGCYILEVTGNLDSNTAPEMSQEVEQHLEAQTKDLVIDFSNVDYISSAGLRVIIKANHILSAANNKVILCGLKDYVREVFDMAGLSNIFDIRQDLDAVLPDGKGK